MLLGDVFIPKTIINYLASGAAVPDGTIKDWDIQTSGNAYRADSRLLDRIRAFKHVYAETWAEWKQDTAALCRELLGADFDDALQSRVTREDALLLAEEGPLASGEFLGKSTEFVTWLKSKDRKFAAIDMESSGAMELADLSSDGHTRFLAIRGISDFADERKPVVEDKYRGAFRQIALENACTFLWAAISANLFAMDAVSAQDAKAPAPNMTLAHEDYLTRTDVTFQHRSKRFLTLADLFVYPDLGSLTPQGGRLQIKLSSATLADFASLAAKTLLIGEEQSGKTALAKTLCYEYYQKGAAPLLFNGRQFKTADFERVIKGAETQQYGAEVLESQFAQGTAIIVVDDFNATRLNKRNQQKLLQHLSTIANKVILFGTMDLLLLDTQYTDFGGFSFFEILPFGHVRRSDLITKWVSLGRESTATEAEIYKSVDIYQQHVNGIILRNIVPPKPFFICTIMQTFETTLPSDYTLTSYGHCYQSLIVEAFMRAGVQPNEIDSHVNYLAELAYFMMQKKGGKLSTASYQEFEAEYAQKYFVHAEADIGEMLLRTRILRYDENNNIEFSYRYTYYFYCSKYMCEHFDKPEIQAAVTDVCAAIHLESNANIVIFMAHHSRDSRLIDEILLHTMLRFSGTTQATLNAEETSHFVEYERTIPKLVIEQRDIKKSRQKVLEIKDRIEEYEDRSAEEEPTKKSVRANVCRDSQQRSVHRYIGPDT